METRSPRMVPGDPHQGPTPHERAVELAERAGCRGVCYGAEAICIEPDNDGPHGQQKGWDYVGEGNGGYKQVQDYSYVGLGAGAWDKSENVVVRSWRIRPVWLCLLSLATLVLVGFLFHALYQGVTSTTTGLGQGAFDLYNCVQGDVESWEIPQRQWCCSRYAKGCPVPAAGMVLPPSHYDCDAGLKNWKWGWSDPKKAWCCDHEQKGCGSPTSAAASNTQVMPYDCHRDFDKWQSTWTVGQRAWCCKHEEKACPDGYTTLHPTAQPVPPPPPPPYSCQQGMDDVAAWPAGKKAWCCQQAKVGCPH